MNSKKNVQKTYKKINFTYSVYGENKKFGGNAIITNHQGSFTEESTITLDPSYKTLTEAEIAIIEKVENWIDTNLS